MTAVQVLAAGAALLTIAGLLIMVHAAVPRLPGHPRVRITRPRLTWDAFRWPGAGVVGLLVWAFTSWPALGLGSAAAVLALPSVVSVDSRAQTRIERVEAVEEWARRLADVLAIGVGLEQAIQTAARSAPAAIHGEVATLSARLAARTPTQTALRAFSDDLDDAGADLVVASLVLASRRRGPGVAAALTSVADSVGEDVAARRRIEADRAKPRTTARAVTAITFVIIAAGLLNGGYTAPYGTPLGQLVLATTLGFFGAALWWMHSMTRSARPERILRSDEVAA